MKIYTFVLFCLITSFAKASGVAPTDLRKVFAVKYSGQVQTIWIGAQENICDRQPVEGQEITCVVRWVHESYEELYVNTGIVEGHTTDHSKPSFHMSQKSKITTLTTSYSIETGDKIQNMVQIITEQMPLLIVFDGATGDWSYGLSMDHLNSF